MSMAVNLASERAGNERWLSMAPRVETLPSPVVSRESVLASERMSERTNERMVVEYSALV